MQTQTAKSSSIPKFPSSKTYMSSAQLEWFRSRLANMQVAATEDIEEATRLATQDAPEGDECDVADYKIIAAQQEALISRLHRQQKEIRAALRRIDDGDYGYCEETGDEIGLERLKANPLARYSIEAQERIERIRKGFGH